MRVSPSDASHTLSFEEQANSRDGVEPKKVLLSEEQKERLMRMEGESKISELILLEINYPKAILFAILMTLSIVGLLFIKYSKRLRARIFYSQVGRHSPSKATHVYVAGSDDIDEISNASVQEFHNDVRVTFFYRSLKYEVTEDTYYPVGFRYIDHYATYSKENYAQAGLSTEEVARHTAFYGANQHQVEIPGYFEYHFDVMTKPFFIFQYFVFAIWVFEGIFMSAIIVGFFSLASTSFNYALLWVSYKKIKESAEKEFPVKVVRNGEVREIKNIELVPGDVYIPTEQIPCDSIMLRGELFVDEVSLTGENVPISKTKLSESSQLMSSSHWLYEGSKLETMKENSLAMAVHVGFGSRRGRIIRTILNYTVKQPELFSKLLVFYSEIFIVAVIIYCATLPLLLSLDIEPIMVVIRFLVFITFCFPAPMPVFFNTVYSICLIRMLIDGITGTESEKTVESSRLKTLCFDKTGTITFNTMSLAEVFEIQDGNTVKEIKGSIEEKQLIRDIFATCHSVEEIGGKLKGDEIDLKMFQATNGTLQANQSMEVVRDVIVQGKTLEVLKINQYESQFQSMSVMFRVKDSGRVIIAVKGSPEKIHHYSSLKFNDFDGFIKKLSLRGYRSIAFGFKEVSNSEVSRYMNASREDFLKGSRIQGVVTFVNELKEDATQTLSTLTQADINIKIITGDNIFLAVKTAFMAGMIPEGNRVIVAEGDKIMRDKQQGGELICLEDKQGQLVESVVRMDNFAFQPDKDVIYAVDNAFIEKDEGFVHRNVRIYARITPQNKALIVRKHIEKENAKIEKRSFCQRVFGAASYKVGMVGDGANDLIAIKQANIGIGIQNSDAVYSSSFGVKELSQIVTIIKEGKNAERQVIEMVQYFTLNLFVVVICYALMLNDSAAFADLHITYRIFGLVVLMTIFVSLSGPADRLSKYMPCSNFMGLQHHLVFWGSYIIMTIGFVVGYQLIYRSDDFVRNTETRITFSDGWSGENMSGTVMFLLVTTFAIMMAPAFMRGAPWKQPFYTNIPRMVLISLNIVALGLIYFFTAELPALTKVPISRRWAAIELGIGVGFGCLLIAYNKIIECLRLHERPDPELDQEEY